jgi:hypothetical protein
MLKKGDVILIASMIIVIALSFFGVHYYKNMNIGKHRIAVIKQNSVTIKEIDLDNVQKPQQIKLTGRYQNIILVEKGRIRFEKATCPDKVCVKSGWLTKFDDTAFCVPNRAYIKIEGSNTKVDGVAY